MGLPSSRGRWRALATWLRARVWHAGIGIRLITCGMPFVRWVPAGCCKVARLQPGGYSKNEKIGGFGSLCDKGLA